VSSDTQPTTGRSNNRTIAMILAVLGVLSLVVGFVYLAVGHHALRTSTGIVVGVVLLGFAWWVSRKK
jgi:hypothetical protein